MTRIKKAALAMALVILAMPLVACNRDEKKVQPLDSVASQPVYLNFFSSGTLTGNDVIKYWVDLFTETYNKQVYVNFQTAEYYADEGLSYRELLEKRLHSSVPDDLYIISAEDVLSFEKKGYWMDLSGLACVQNLSSAALYQSTYNNKVFSLPLSFTGFGFLWNVDMLAANGLTVPQNLGEFLKTCETLRGNGILPYGANKGYSLTVPAIGVGLSALYASDNRDALVQSLNSGQTGISTYMKDGYAFLAMLIEKGYMDPQQALDTKPNEGDRELFLAQGCAFICVSLGEYENMQATFQTEMTGLPVLADGSVAVYGADKRLCVNPNSPHLETALQFMEMVGDPQALAKSAQLEGVLPSASGVDASEYPGRESMVALLQQPGQVPNQDFALHFNTWESIRDVARALCGGASVEQACTALDQKQQQELEIFGK